MTTAKMGGSLRPVTMHEAEISKLNLIVREADQVTHLSTRPIIVMHRLTQPL